ncbi:unnamed protein product [Didymodactylos carnosus]|uniref:Intradiol ring-cleavage dioxygenases domain-containing protein n=1 Tax=Didymodactylos carnosus TaxID=1234261 RepID=A0A815PX68_9BILA|nr:unnamed protein product [Didymodactylos carnosus]CAF1455465.1 unnamed protein product [Didymodactylos carnosus]CAF4171503.1 unnamed protein product [Didymodactylos carnosus]CAF4327425.1 unnamed protein product [Didymodactylos carnosus]
MTNIFFLLSLFSLLIHEQVRSDSNTCTLTEPDILGPYWLNGAPEKSNVVCDHLPANDVLKLSGRIVDFDSKCERGIRDVRLDIWQANYNGVYSTGKSSNDWFCRGVFHADRNGYFKISTLFPGRYDDGGYRPAHIHFNITAPGYPKLITQLYFEKDAYLSPVDSCRQCRSDSKSLIASVTHINDIKTYEGYWQIVLSKKSHGKNGGKARFVRGAYINVTPYVMPINGTYQDNIIQ